MKRIISIILMVVMLSVTIFVLSGCRNDTKQKAIRDNEVELKTNENIAKEILEDLEDFEPDKTQRDNSTTKVTIPEVKYKENENVSKYIEKELKTIEDNEVDERIIATKTQVIDDNNKADGKIEIALKNDKAENVTYTIQCPNEQTAKDFVTNFQDLFKAFRVDNIDEYVTIKKDGKKVVMNMSGDFFCEMIASRGIQEKSQTESIKKFLQDSGFIIN